MGVFGLLYLVIIPELIIEHHLEKAKWCEYGKVSCKAKTMIVSEEDSSLVRG